MPRAVWQLINTLVPYAAVWTLMYFCVSDSWWLAIPLVMLAGGLLVRIFIIFHDCGHGPYFASQRANDIAGFLTGVRSEEHTSELQSLMRISYADLFLHKHTDYRGKHLYSR